MAGMSMRRHEAFALALILLALAGCSRLDFVKPSGKNNYKPEPRSYDFKQTSDGKRREDAREQVSMASTALQAGDMAEAERAARAALRLDPKSANANTLMAVVSAQQRKSAEAGAFYAAAAELAPGQGAELNNYGAWLCGNARASEALPYFEQALADPAYADRASALSNAGACAMRSGDLLQVEPNLRSALELDPENIVALDSMTNYLLGHGRYFDARAFSSRRLAVAPLTAAALQTAAEIEQKLGDARAADLYIKRLQTEFPQAATLQPRDASSP